MVISDSGSSTGWSTPTRSRRICPIPGGYAKRQLQRNSVKITVDAYTARSGIPERSDDPIAKVYSAMFPGLFQVLETMPED
jgi:uncharacterized membrane protein (UPF0182 family)